MKTFWLGKINKDTYSMWAPLATRALMQSRLPERAALWMGVSPSQSWNNKKWHAQIFRSNKTKTMHHCIHLWNKTIWWTKFEVEYEKMWREEKIKADQGRGSFSWILRSRTKNHEASTVVIACTFRMARRQRKSVDSRKRLWRLMQSSKKKRWITLHFYE